MSKLNVYDRSLMRRLKNFDPVSKVLKTGQTTSYHTGDDGDLEKGVSRSYSVLTAGQYSGTTNIVINGKTHAMANTCVRDNRTGLMWAQEVVQATIGPATDGKLFWSPWTLAAESCTFATAGDTITAATGTPFSTAALCVGRKITITDTTNNNGIVTVASITTNVITVSENLTDEGPVATTFTTKDDLIWDLKDQANTNSLGGHTDWRIPNILEHYSLVKYGVGAPMIDTTAFPSTPSSTLHTSTVHPTNSAYAKTVLLADGGSGSIVRVSEKWYCRLVGGGN